MPQTLGALLAQQAGAITGRDRERAQLRRLLEPGGPVVAYVHGLAGVGKSTLLHAFAAEARAAAFATVEVDGHVTYSTARRVAGGRARLAQRRAAGVRRRRRGAGGPTLLVGRHVRAAGHGRRLGLPHADPGVAGARARRHRRPRRAWRPLAQLRRRCCARSRSTNLRPTDAVTLLRGRASTPDDAPRINSIARGHPLSLQLAAGALRDRPGLRARRDRCRRRRRGARPRLPGRPRR